MADKDELTASVKATVDKWFATLPIAAQRNIADHLKTKLVSELVSCVDQAPSEEPPTETPEGNSEAGGPSQ